MGTNMNMIGAIALAASASSASSRNFALDSGPPMPGRFGGGEGYPASPLAKAKKREAKLARAIEMRAKAEAKRARRKARNRGVSAPQRMETGHD